MRKIYIKTTLIVMSCIFLFACNDDFMQQDPNKIQDGTTLKSEDELVLFLDQFYRIFFSGHGQNWGQQKGAPWFNNKGSSLIYGDLNTDNMVTSGASAEILNTATPPPASGGLYNGSSGYSTGWYWDVLKNINYFLRNYRAAEPSVPQPTDLNKWVAEAKFFKAAFYFEKLMLYGDVPWYDTDLNIDSEELYKPRDNRTVVADSILSLLNFAEEHIQKESIVPNGRVHINDVRFLKARFCLFEGTFRKYHKELSLEGSANKFLELAAAAAEGIINSGKYKLYQEAANGKHYRELFCMIDMETSSETIRARVYDGASLDRGHANARYVIQNNGNARNGMGAPLGLVEDYLCEDGRPIYIGESGGEYVDNPLFKGYDGLWEELDNRDPRLRQTINKPGEDFSIFSRTNGFTDAKINGINYPAITYNVGEFNLVGSTFTGYTFIKHLILSRPQHEVTQKGTQTAHIYRYAEVLLMYAEAKAELNQITNEDLDKTINALRERAGFDFNKYPSARLTLAYKDEDPRLNKIYATALEYTPTPILREIRRERRVEMVLENRRYEDLVRWKAGKLMEVPMRGMRMHDPLKVDLYSGKNDKGVHTTPEGYKIWAQKAKNGSEIFLDENDFIIVYPKAPGISNGIFPWNDRRYYRPIPIEELSLNPALEQNKGW